MTGDRTMLSFPMGEKLFNYRVAGIAMRDGHVLICEDPTDGFSMLPGGRVEFGETSLEALQREIDEELQCAAKPGEMLFSVENFFERERWNFHELAIYYALELPDDFPFATGAPCMTTNDGECTLDFSWVKAEPGALRSHKLYPDWIVSRLATLSGTPQHVIADDRHSR